MDLFRARTADDGAARQRIRSWVAECLRLTEADTVMVTELRCHEPDCPPIETVVALLRAGEGTRQYKLHKPASDVVRSDIEALVEPVG
jgi:hypothetical protein